MEISMFYKVASAYSCSCFKLRHIAIHNPHCPADHHVETHSGILCICRKGKGQMKWRKNLAGTCDLLTVQIMPGSCLVLITDPQECSASRL